ncbi:MAG TPA: 6-carboxytetrahydropterin synthase QueD [Candidatus Gracilibacteria bacterium]|nr:6-carboxytetrahydropterin synthase QueD [Candidatus Gracilibacteria bacterium]
MLVTKIFTFDAAHQLTNYYGKCERVHGHTYTLEVTLEGDVHSNGMVIDFVLLKRIVKRQVLERLDHHFLNDVLENPSAERLAVWIWDQLSDLSNHLKDELNDPNMAEEIRKLLEDEDADVDTSDLNKTLRLHEVVLWETPTSKVVYNGR